MRGHAPSARELRRERLVGNWGGASEHIGRRWEELGLEVLRARVASAETWPADGYAPEKILPLAGDESLQSALSRAGLPNPDVLMVLRDDTGDVVLQALDFKWSVEFASYGQIRAEAIGALLHRGVAPLRELLSREVGEDPEAVPVLDGVLHSPDLPANRWFLESEENARQEYPIEPYEVIFEEVDPRHFFEPLPGWEMALLLARADRSEGRLRFLDGAEHYYRLGTGLAGAVAQLQVPIFVRQPPPVAAPVAFDWLRTRVRPSTSDNFVQHTEKLMSARAQLANRLRTLARSPYRFADLVEALKARGVALPEREEGLPPRERERWGDVLRKVSAEHKDLVYRTGLRLTQAGLADAEALTRLEADTRRLADRARAAAERLITAALEGEPRGTEGG